jgi:hypothetical protein
VLICSDPAYLVMMGLGVQTDSGPWGAPAGSGNVLVNVTGQSYC